MQIIFSLFIFIFGLLVGSFLNCVIYRLEQEKSFLKGRSYCPHCKHTLSVRDLIPVFSYLLLRGRCRYCKGKISWQYPAVEIATGAMFLLISNFQFPISNEILIFNFQTLVNLLFLFSISSFLIIIFVFDLKHYIIPDKIIFPSIGIVFLYRVFEFLSLNHWKLIEKQPFGEFALRPDKLKIGNFGALLNPLYAALAASAFFLLIFLVSRGRWLGFGDVKLAFFMGLFLGFPDILVGLFFAFLIGAIIGVGLIFSGRKKLKSEIPFGPFLIIGVLIGFFWGGTLIDWYLNLLV